jgi:hypothetical protein
MSATMKSRDVAIGKVKHLLRMKQPIALHLSELPVRNPIVRALAQRASTSAAGAHIRSRGAQRRAEKVALQKAVYRGDE